MYSAAVDRGRAGIDHEDPGWERGAGVQGGRFPSASHLVDQGRTRRHPEQWPTHDQRQDGHAHHPQSAGEWLAALQASTLRREENYRVRPK